MKVECRPISTYPVPESRTRVRARFHRVKHSSSGWKEKVAVLLSDNLDLLEREALHLGCKHLVIEADFKEDQIRQDGWPKSTARPSSPRVVISLLESKHGPLRYPCDTFDRFEDNVRAVSLALEALRTVDRYGVTRRGNHLAEVRAFLTAYHASDYSGGYGQDLSEPTRTITTRHRLGLVTVLGVDFQIVDIGMRMLEPHELLAAQFGRFAASYDLSPARTKSAKVCLIGNSVPPEPVEALIAANAPARLAFRGAA